MFSSSSPFRARLKNEISHKLGNLGRLNNTGRETKKFQSVESKTKVAGRSRLTKLALHPIVKTSRRYVVNSPNIITM